MEKHCLKPNPWKRILQPHTKASGGTYPPDCLLYTSYVAEDVTQFPWGGSIDFVYEGSPVEVTVRTMDQAEAVVSQCLEGKIQVYPAAWTTNGYYNYIYLAEFSFLRPLDDSTGFLARCRAQCEPYPPRLQAAVVRHFLAQGSMWLGNFHYDSAIHQMCIRDSPRS